MQEQEWHGFALVQLCVGCGATPARIVLAPGAPKTCDVETLAKHFLKDTFESAKEPLTVRFNGPPNSLIEPFSVGYVLGFSRALAALLILEIMCRMSWSVEELQEMSPVIRSLQYVWCVYDPAMDTFREVEETILAKMRGSEHQRPDLLQLAHAFSFAAEMKVSQGKQRTREALLNAVMAEYNRSQPVGNCRLEGDERTGVKFLAVIAPEVCPYLREVWNEHRVRESPVTVHMLAAPWLMQPSGGAYPEYEHLHATMVHGCVANLLHGCPM
jgi:hypothetical protein